MLTTQASSQTEVESIEIDSKFRQAVGLNKHPRGSDSWLMSPVSQSVSQCILGSRLMSPSVLSPPQDRVPNLIGCGQSVLTSMNRTLYIRMARKSKFVCLFLFLVR
jgi:hypothetical protein